MGIPRVSEPREAALSRTLRRRVALCFLAVIALMSAAGCATMRADNVPPANDTTGETEDPNVGRFVERSVRVDGADYRYRAFVPAARFRRGPVPTILFLHGTGERGSDGEKPTLVGLGPYVRAHADTFPAIAVFPQAPDGQDWKGTAMRIAYAALDDASRAYGGDIDRTYLTGLSMGGYGTWELALTQPQRFAALVPVCGGLTAPRAERDLHVTPLRGETDPPAALAQRLKATPIWIFHGGKDDVVPPSQSRAIYAALQAADAVDARYTEFPEANHNSWDPAYSQTPELWAWLFAQRRK